VRELAAVAVPSGLTTGMDFSRADLVVDSCLELTPRVLADVVVVARRGARGDGSSAGAGS
jgi:hypothetical protein